MVDGQARRRERFVEGSIIGWYNYLYGDNKAANAAYPERQSRHDRRVVDGVLYGLHPADRFLYDNLAEQGRWLGIAVRDEGARR